jgi:hypothetical protein
LILIGPPANQHPVFLLAAEARVREPVRQLSVVGEEDQSFALKVQSSHREETPRQRHQVAYCLAVPLGRERGDDAPRLVQGDVKMCFRAGKPAAINPDIVPRRVGLAPQCGRLAVDGDTLSQD